MENNGKFVLKEKLYFLKPNLRIKKPFSKIKINLKDVKKISLNVFGDVENNNLKNIINVILFLMENKNSKIVADTKKEFIEFLTKYIKDMVIEQEYIQYLYVDKKMSVSKIQNELFLDNDEVEYAIWFNEMIDSTKAIKREFEIKNICWNEKKREWIVEIENWKWNWEKKCINEYLESFFVGNKELKKEFEFIYEKNKNADNNLVLENDLKEFFKKIINEYNLVIKKNKINTMIYFRKKNIASDKEELEIEKRINDVEKEELEELEQEIENVDNEIYENKKWDEKIMEELKEEQENE